jgi:hypothetical protein
MARQNGQGHCWLCYQPGVNPRMAPTHMRSCCGVTQLRYSVDGYHEIMVQTSVQQFEATSAAFPLLLE